MADDAVDAAPEWKTVLRKPSSRGWRGRGNSDSNGAKSWRNSDGDGRSRVHVGSGRRWTDDVDPQPTDAPTSRSWSGVAAGLKPTAAIVLKTLDSKQNNSEAVVTGMAPPPDAADATDATHATDKANMADKSDAADKADGNTILALLKSRASVPATVPSDVRPPEVGLTTQESALPHTGTPTSIAKTASAPDMGSHGSAFTLPTPRVPQPVKLATAAELASMSNWRQIDQQSSTSLPTKSVDAEAKELDTEHETEEPCAPSRVYVVDAMTAPDACGIVITDEVSWRLIVHHRVVPPPITESNPIDQIVAANGDTVCEIIARLMDAAHSHPQWASLATVCVFSRNPSLTVIPEILSARYFHIENTLAAQWFLWQQMQQQQAQPQLQQPQLQLQQFQQPQQPQLQPPQLQQFQQPQLTQPQPPQLQQFQQPQLPQPQPPQLQQFQQPQLPQPQPPQLQQFQQPQPPQLQHPQQSQQLHQSQHPEQPQPPQLQHPQQPQHSYQHARLISAQASVIHPSTAVFPSVYPQHTPPNFAVQPPFGLQDGRLADHGKLSVTSSSMFVGHTYYDDTRVAGRSRGNKQRFFKAAKLTEAQAAIIAHAQRKTPFG